MSVTSCCVCFEQNATIPLNTKDSNNDTITSKLESVVSEVQWKDSFSICPQCLRTLDIVIEFKNLCLRSSSFRIDHKDSHYESKGSFTIQEDSKETIDFGGSEESIGVQDLEQNIVTCDICKIEVNSDEHLYVHNREIHESKRTYKSELLSLHSNNESEVNETLSIEGEVQSDDRFKGTSSVFICFHCSKTYKSKLMLGKHIKLQHDNHKFKCTNCTSFFQNQSLLEEHHKAAHGNESVEKKSKSYICRKCKKSYKNEKIMKKHLETCDGEIFLKNSNSENEIRCFKCNEVFGSENIKFEHVLNKHNIDLNVELTCTVCYKQFSNSSDFQIHSEVEHAEENNVILKKRKKHSGRSYSCEICTKVFGFVKEVVEHCVKEHGMNPKLVKPYLCDKCDTRFTTSANMIQHKQYHEGNRSHICSFCGKSYITKSDLNVHEYTHLNKRNYKCEICERAFNTNKNLRSHILVVHTNSSLWKYHCNICEKRFPLKSGYDQHIRRHNGDKQFQCLICKKAFISGTELRRHMTFHSNVRAFKCSHCDKEYKNRGVYEVHLKKVHGIGNAKIPVRVKKFACHVCPSTFYDKQKLSRHLCTHTGIKPYPCTLCEKRFTDKSYLKHHLKVTHNVVEIPPDEIDM